MASEYLFELGLKLYQQGRYSEALHEFNKALLVQPNFAPALKYIRYIEDLTREREAEEEIAEAPAVIAPAFKATFPKRGQEIDKTLGVLEEQIQAQKIKPKYAQVPGIPAPVPVPVVPAGLIKAKPIAEKAAAFMVLKLDDSLKKLTQPIEIEQGKSIVLKGEAIQRFLVTQSDNLIIQRKSPDELLVTGKDIGYTYMHVWDSSGRWTLEFLTISERPKGPTLEEEARLAEEKGGNFKLSYSLDWIYYETGRRINDLKRSDYSYVHNLDLTGQTPYGDLDSSVTVNRFLTETDISHYTIGLTHGQIGPFKDFTLRGFDFFDIPPDFSNLSFPGVSLRGGMFSSPAFNKRLNYTAFSGREHWSGYGALAPGLMQKRESYLSGLNLKYAPTLKQDYLFTLVHGWGKDRQEELNSLGYDFINRFKFNNWDLGYEVAHDSQAFAYTVKSDYYKNKLSMGAELRNIDKEFYSISGMSWLQGELGGLFHLDYRPWDNLNIYANLDVYKDRLYPAPDNLQRWNEDLNWNLIYRLNRRTNLRLNYTLRNELGRVSQYRYQSSNIGISRTFKLIRDISFYCNYYHQENDNFSSPTSSYVNERIYTGFRFNLITDLYYFINKETNWLKETYTSLRSEPNALETGVDWSRQIGNSPWYGVLRFTYRDEEDTASNLSFLPGEDYIEGYTELTFRPKPDLEIFGSCRLRNVWQENPATSKRFEASFNAGLRYLWDTGVSWQPVGNIDGYVFKDYNADGIMQRDEPPVQGIKVWLGKDKFQVTDIFGYYKFKGIRGRRAYVNLDTKTIPSGFVLTVPQTQKTTIEHHRTIRLSFGIVARSEISGFVFEDVDNDGKYGKNDLGIRKVAIILEDGSRSITDDSGRYAFPRISPGGHIITLDLNSLPVYYLPEVPVKKEVTLFEGVTYSYNIPLKRSK